MSSDLLNKNRYESLYCYIWWWKRSQQAVLKFCINCNSHQDNSPDTTSFLETLKDDQPTQGCLTYSKRTKTVNVMLVFRKIKVNLYCIIEFWNIDIECWPINPFTFLVPLWTKKKIIELSLLVLTCWFSSKTEGYVRIKVLTF